MCSAVVVVVDKVASSSDPMGTGSALICFSVIVSSSDPRGLLARTPLVKAFVELALELVLTRFRERLILLRPEGHAEADWEVRRLSG